MSPILSFLLEQLQSQKIVSPFVIVHGPWVDVQWSAIREACQTATGFFAHQDVLDIKDYSSLLGKDHSLKVEYKKNIDSDLLHKQESYDDIGSREINERLSMAPAGDMKILMIEHIDRATIGAANALLKSLEEPLPHRFIIASTTNKDSILPTILSRALLIHCDASYHPDQLTGEQKESFETIVSALQTKNIAILTKWATQIAKEWWSREFLSNLLSYYDTQDLYGVVPVIIQTLRQIDSNVSAEHSLFQLFLLLIK